tara:strand:+ start:504 stop:1121 length:618 start_codon:yes stop_codon:yes gene_type:complete
MNKIKTIYFMRHAESNAQICRKREIDSPSLLDCYITRLGVIQATSAWSDKNNLPELIVVSPLTRAIQTAIIAFDNIDIPIICHPYLKEVGGSKLPENHFRGVVNLLNDKNLQSYSLFDKIDISLITSEWCNSYEANNAPRKVTYLSDKLLKWLLERPEKRILCVTHYNVIKNILGGVGEINNTRIFTCLLYEDSYDNSVKIDLIH